MSCSQFANSVTVFDSVFRDVNLQQQVNYHVNIILCNVYVINLCRNFVNRIFVFEPGFMW